MTPQQEKSISSEKALVKALGVKSLSTIPVDKAVDFFKMVPTMSKEVQLKALEQMPEFRSLATSAMSTIGQALDSALRANHKGAKKVHKAFEHERIAIAKLLEKPDLTLSEEFLILDRIADNVDRQQSFDREDKNFRGQILTAAIGAVVVVAGTVFAIATGRLPKQ